MGTIANLDVDFGMNVGAFITSAGKARGAMTDLGSVADRVYRDTRTAAEVFQERLSQLGGLYSRGQIDAETYGRAVRKLRDEMSGAAQKAADFARNAAAQQKEAMAAAARQAAQLADAMARGGQVTRSVMTPAEAYADRIRELAVLLRQGAISQETFTRAEAQAIGQMRAASAAAAGSRQGSFAGMFKTLAGGVTAGFLAAQAVRELGHAMVDAGKRSLTLAADFERAEIAFTTMYRSADRAKELMGQLKQFSAQTPFEFPEIKDAAVKLAGFGTEQRQIVPTLRMLGDLAAGTGANINELAETYGKARIQGRAFSRDIYEFSNRGIPIQEALAATFGVTKNEIMGLVETGQVGFGEIQRALESLTAEGGKFHGGLEAQSKTLHGLASTIHDNLNLALAEFGERLAVDLQLKKNAEGTVEWTNSLKTDLAPALAQITTDLLALSKSAAETTNFLGNLFGLDVFSNGGGGLSSFHEAVTRLNLQFAQLTGNTEREKQLLDELGSIAANVDKKRFGGGKKPDEEKLRFEDNLPDTSLADSITKLNAELRQQIVTFGASADAIKIWELQQQGATREQLAFAYAASEQLAALRDQKTAMKETAKAADDLRKKESELVAELQKKIATFGKSAEAERLFDFEMQHGVTAASQQARALVNQLETLRAQEKATKAAAKAQEELREKAKRILEETQTPLQKYQARIAELKKLFDEGLLNRDQAIQAAQAAHKDFIADKKNGRRGEAEVKPAALLKGSAAAFSAANRLGSSGKSEATKTREVLTKEARETNRHLRAMEKAQRRKEQLKVINNFN